MCTIVRKNEIPFRIELFLSVVHRLHDAVQVKNFVDPWHLLHAFSRTESGQTKRPNPIAMLRKRNRTM